MVKDNPAAAGRREFLMAAGLSSAMMAFTPGDVVAETLAPPPEEKPKYHVKFGVVGMSHDHIHGMIGAMQRGGGELVAYWGQEPDKLAVFAKRYPGVKVARTQAEVIDDPQVQLVISSQIANERAGIGVRAMKAGKDFLADKPGITTLDDLAVVRKTIAETRRLYGILYSERLEVKAAVHAGELIKQGAIGKVIQTINIAPHQIDQFLYYTGSTEAQVAASQVANIRHPDRPKFQDFGDMMLRGNAGFGYVRLDWFTPNGLGTWGDGRLFILGTDGYIEVRKYTNVAVGKQGNNLFIVDGKQARYIDCSNGPLPFGPQFISDIVNRTHTAQDQTQALLAAELAIKAQANAVHAKVEG